MRVVVLAASSEDDESHSAFDWAKRNRFDACRLSPNEFRAQLASADVVWCHAPSSVPFLPDDALHILREWLHKGGRLLLSLLATPLAQRLGAPGAEPLVELPRQWTGSNDALWPDDFRDWPDYPHIRGVQGWEAHPLFDGLQRGTYTWQGREGVTVCRSYYRSPVWPEGRVVGVDRAYVQLDAGTAIAWEFEVDKGRILCLGANVHLGAPNDGLAAQRDRLLTNAIAYLDPQRPHSNDVRSWWPNGLSGVRQDDALIPLMALNDVDESGLPSPLVFNSARPDDSVFTLAGRRTLVTGTERDGIKEVWFHPICLSSEGEAWSANGIALRAEHVSIEPGVVSRELSSSDGARWREHIVVSPVQPALHLSLTSDGKRPTASQPELTISLRVRMQWPIPNDALQPVSLTMLGDGTRWAITVRTASSAHSAAILIDGADYCEIHESPSAPRLHVRMARSARAVRLLMVASVGGSRALVDGTLAAVNEGINGSIAQQRARITELRESSTSIETPEPDLDTAWPWSIARLTNALADVKGVGTGLLAGLASTRPGWGDARPGYAWFFGRDACWCGDALLALGRFDEARCALEFLAATRDVNGKMAHEITTSGVAHYDAADATPLWLRLVAAYAEWTGDLATVRAHWDVVRQAIDFVCSTDRDGDGLPQNRDVGHGWIESGPLGGGATTSYNASIWIDALRRLEPVARALDDRASANAFQELATRATAAFNSSLRDPATGRIALHRRVDGTLDTTLTALSAVPILLGVDNLGTDDAITSDDDDVDALAHSRFSAPWGVRLVPNDSPGYAPRGYHGGAVWPLFTGWVSLAEFARWKPDVALQHLLSIARLTQSRTKGAFDEVLDGDTGRAAGVCPDQAWSAAMLVSPLLLGMLGARPVGAERRITISPRWPTSWRRAKIHGLRVGQARLSIEMQRVGLPNAIELREAHRYTLLLLQGAALDVTIESRSASPKIVHLTPHAAVIVDVPVPTTHQKARGDGRR